MHTNCEYCKAPLPKTDNPAEKRSWPTCDECIKKYCEYTPSIISTVAPGFRRGVEVALDAV